jgi:hypothetical protein
MMSHGSTHIEAENINMPNGINGPFQPSAGMSQHPSNGTLTSDRSDRTHARSEDAGDGSLAWWARMKCVSRSSFDYLQQSWATVKTTTKRSWVALKTLVQRLLDYLQDTWFLEITACVFAIVLFVAEIGMLAAFDKRTIDSWPWQWSLNSAVALITTLLESSLLFAIVSCLGQMKWLWFSADQGEEKRLIWIDFLARSNTPIGALSLLLFHATTWK